jgi:Domain of Unknown Function (DUF928)
MFQIRLSIAHWLRAIFSLILAIILILGYPAQALANPFQNIIEQIQSIFAPPPKTKAKLGNPIGRSKGGAGRGRCPAFVALGKDEIPLTAFVPVIQEKQSLSSKLDNVLPSKLNYVWGQTTEAYPTFWFYIPYVYKESEVQYGKFVLLDKDKHLVTAPILVKVPVGDKPSIAKFTLPENAKPLEINQEYNWYFSIICNKLKPSRNPGVTGWIERVPSRVFPVNDYVYYAKQGIWYDTVTRLFNNQNSQTQQLQQDKLLLIKAIFKDAIEKPEKEENFNDEDKLNQIAKQIADFEPQELKSVQIEQSL